MFANVMTHCLCAAAFSTPDIWVDSLRPDSGTEGAAERRGFYSFYFFLALHSCCLPLPLFLLRNPMLLEKLIFQPPFPIFGPIFPCLLFRLVLSTQTLISTPFVEPQGERGEASSKSPGDR